MTTDSLWGKVVKFFRRPTPEEAYQSGRELAHQSVACSANPAAEACHLFHLASGGFNTTDSHRAFDRGITDALTEMGYQDHEEF